MAQNQPPPPPPFPSPEELKSKITEFMKQNFGDHVSVATITEPEAAVAEEEEKPEKTEHKEFRIPSAAARHQSASGPVRHQTGGSEESPRDCGLRSLQTRQLPPAPRERGSEPRSGN